MDAGRAALDGFDRYRLIEAKACFYTVARDDRFVLRPLGEAGWMVSACSGHGFKFGALIGEAVADGIEGRRPAGELAAWAAGRGAEARPPNLA
jgi:sarcosine oxidase/sarcosine oxidase subunit beta